MKNESEKNWHCMPNQQGVFSPERKWIKNEAHYTTNNKGVFSGKKMNKKFYTTEHQ